MASSTRLDNPLSMTIDNLFRAKDDISALVNLYDSLLLLLKHSSEFAKQGHPEARNSHLFTLSRLESILKIPHSATSQMVYAKFSGKVELGDELQREYGEADRLVREAHNMEHLTVTVVDIIEYEGVQWVATI